MADAADQEIGAPSSRRTTDRRARVRRASLGDAGSVAGRAGGWSVTDEMVDVILQLRPSHFQFVNFLVRGEIDLFLDAIDCVVEAVIFIEHLTEMVVRAFQPANDLTMFRKFSQDRMMKVHGEVSHLLLNGLCVDWNRERADATGPKQAGLLGGSFVRRYERSALAPNCRPTIAK